MSLSHKKEEENEEDVKQKVRQRKEWRDNFLSRLDEYGMEYEEQEPKVSVCGLFSVHSFSYQHGFNCEIAFTLFPCFHTSMLLLLSFLNSSFLHLLSLLFPHPYLAPLPLLPPFSLPLSPCPCFVFAFLPSVL